VDTSLSGSLNSVPVVATLQLSFCPWGLTSGVARSRYSA